MMAAESWIDHLAQTLKVAPESLRAKHLYGEGDVTHFTQTLTGCQVRACYDGVLQQSDFQARADAVAAFNKVNRYDWVVW